MTAIAPVLQAFFAGRLITQRNASPETIAAYRVPRTWRSEVSTRAVSHASSGFGLAVMACEAAWAKVGIPRSAVARRLAAM